MAWSPDYTTVADLKAYLRVDDTIDDAQMALAVTTASRSVDLTCGRQFGNALQVRYYTARFDVGMGRFVVDIDDLLSISDISIDNDGDGSFEANLYLSTLLPRNASVNGRPYTQIDCGVTPVVPVSTAPYAVCVSGYFGWSTIPAPVVQATLIQASRFLARRDSPYGVTGSPESGGELRLLSRLDPDVAVALRPFRRWWGVAA